MQKLKEIKKIKNTLELMKKQKCNLNFIFDQDDIVDKCNKYRSCIFDKKTNKKILPINIGTIYELKFENHNLISKIQKKHKIVKYGELIKNKK